MYKSTDAGLNFTEYIVEGPNAYWTASYDMGISGDGTIYIVGEDDQTGTYNYTPRIWRSTDGGMTWDASATGSLGTLSYAWTTGCWVDPDDSNHLVVAGYGHGTMWYTMDGGANWTATGPSCTTAEFASHPDLGLIYAAPYGAGVFESADGGVTWTDLTGNLPGLYIYGMAVDLKNGYLFAGGNSTGVNRLPITPARLWAQYPELHETGGTVDFSLSAGAGPANKSYFLLGSLSGPTPGLNLPGGSHLPLTWDNFTDSVVAYANTGNFPNFFGTLDADGNGTAQLDTLGPLFPGFVGVELTFAYLAVNVWPWYASNEVTVVIVP